MSVSMVNTAARMAYEAVRAYDKSLGLPDAGPWETRPAAVRAHTVDEVIAALGDPSMTPAALHVAWMRTKLEAGWTLGSTYNPDSNPPTSPSLVPWTDLPAEKRARSVIFLSVVQGYAAATYNAPMDVQGELDRQAAERAAAGAVRKATLSLPVVVNTPGRPISGATRHAGLVTDAGDGLVVAVIYFPVGFNLQATAKVQHESAVDRVADPNAMSWQFPDEATPPAPSAA